MVENFAADLAEWSDFFAYIGTAGATLLGLLFVAVSLRLDIFHRAEVADVRDFARLTMFSFLMLVIISGITLMPTDRPQVLGAVTLVCGIAGAVYLFFLGAEKRRLDLIGPAAAPPGTTLWSPRMWSYMSLVVLSFLGLIVTGALLLASHWTAFLALGAAEVLLLATGTFNAWLMLTHAGAPPPAP